MVWGEETFLEGDYEAPAVDVCVVWEAGPWCVCWNRVDESGQSAAGTEHKARKQVDVLCLPLHIGPRETQSRRRGAQPSTELQV